MDRECRSKEDVHRQFLNNLRHALGTAEQAFVRLFADEEFSLEIIPASRVSSVVNGWSKKGRRLDWSAAIREWWKKPKSAFVGAGARGQIWLLALINLSCGQLRTKLLYVEKNAEVLSQRGLGLAIIDRILWHIARKFSSRLIVIHRPVSAVVHHYQSLGYEVLTQSCGRVTALAKVMKSV